MSGLILQRQLKVEGFSAARWLPEWSTTLKQMAEWIKEVSIFSLTSTTITSCTLLLILPLFLPLSSLFLPSCASVTFVNSHYKYIINFTHVPFMCRVSLPTKSTSLRALTTCLMPSWGFSLELTLENPLSRPNT